MSSAGRGTVWSLLTAILILLIGVVGLLYVANKRDQQYESEIRDLRRKLIEKDAQIERLQNTVSPLLAPSDTSLGAAADTSWR